MIFPHNPLKNHITETISNLPLRRCAIHGADEQIVQRRPLRGAERAEQIVLDDAEPVVGQTELVLTAGRQLDDVAAAIGGIPTSGDQLALLKHVEQSNNVARIQAQRSG